MADAGLAQSVYDLLANWRGPDSLKGLFWSTLNYDRVNQPLPRTNWPKAAAEALATNPLVFAEAGEFKILYGQLAADHLRLTDERVVVNRLLREYPYALFIFSDKSQTRWHFVNVKDAPRFAKEPEDGRRPRLLFRRIAVGPEERVRTAAERISKLDVATIPRTLFELSALEVQSTHDDAFDVEAVTEAFFKDYKRVFADLQDRLRPLTRDGNWAHDYALQLLNRLMFLYFIQRKRWLGDDPDFFRSFWEAYKAGGRQRDKFFEDWLSVLFFEAFNEKFVAGRRDRQHLPPAIREALALAPFLNGGLFSPNALDRMHTIPVPDAFFESLFDRFDGLTPGFLERYNFTITEDTPFDQEVAVDPEMIGKVYESLVNITFEGVEEEDRRGTAGIFYTPRVEIDLMCRLALLDFLTNHLGEQRKSLLRDAVFAYDPEEKQAADAAFAKANLWPQLNALLREVTCLDPACGSGSFLVGMLSILDDLQARANGQLGAQETPYERRKRIIGQSLYGVDVMPWAVHVAELRLWLQVVIETPLHSAELKFRPLLPNLSFKVRPGDSLVQEVGGINFSLHHAHLDIPAPLKGTLTKLKGEKLKFFNGDPDASYRTEDALKRAELALFREIVETKAKILQDQIKTKRQKARERAGEQPALLREAKANYDAKGVREAEAGAAELEAELEQVRQARAALHAIKDVPFVWDIAFVEIFEGERGGFDIVVGNPPYVRKEKIAPPTDREEDHSADHWLELKRDYKSKLQTSVAAAYPKFFKYKPQMREQGRKLDGKSDLYIYFYLHGLSLLNAKGAFCFITSNSWLDVGYGVDLQEFLLRHSQVKLILDNQVKRSFKQADVNTVIALLGPPDDRHSAGLEKTARFVMFKKPFQEVLSPVIFAEIDGATNRLLQPEFRVIAKRQADLLEEGISLPDEDGGRRSGMGATYAGNKWGGKYLRAPEIYWTILDRGKNKLARLGNVVRIETYLNTGGADGFFIVRGNLQSSHVNIIATDGSTFDLPLSVVRPFFKSPQEITYLDTSRCVPQWFIVLPELESRNRRVEDYIKWGERHCYHVKSATSRRTPWYRLPIQATNPAPLIWPRLHNDRLLFALNEQRIPYTNFYGLWCQHPRRLATALASTITSLSREIFGKTNFGQGVLKTDGNDLKQLYVPNPEVLGAAEEFGALLDRPILPVWDEVMQPDRRALDGIIFEFLGLTQAERDAVYEAVINLIDNRLKKATSLEKTSQHPR